MTRSAFTLLVYGFIVALGGVIGFMQAQSTPSLFMGLLIGGLSSFFAILCFKQHVTGLILGGTNALLTLTFFLYRLIDTGKLMPAGLMVLVSAAVAWRVGKTFFKLTKTRKHKTY